MLFIIFLIKKSDKEFTDIKYDCQLILSYLFIIFVRLTDIYFLRRVLDKDYIKNVIVYSGGISFIILYSAVNTKI